MSKQGLQALVTVLWVMLMCASLVVAEIPQKEADDETKLGKYVNAKQAFTMWHTNPDTVSLLDVRTPQEYQFVGHAPMARNIPLILWSGIWDPEKKRYGFKPNPDFIEHVKRHYKKDDKILVMCRSGSRAAKAVNAMADAGYTNAYVIVDSFEGDKVSDPASYYDGKRMKNGWKNSGAPWGYKNDPRLVYPPVERESK